MHVAEFATQSNVVVIAGKGGVGKTTVAGALALSAARAGLRVVVVGLDDQQGLPALFGRSEPLTYAESELASPVLLGRDAGGGVVMGQVITSEEALLEYLASHGLKRVAKRLVQTGTLDVIATAIPGIREVLVLGKLKQLELSHVADLIVVDAPATGHALTFLTSSKGVLDAARGGPLRTQAQSVVEMLSDGARCSVILVTIPEETPINELVQSAYQLEDEVGIKLGPVVVNGCVPSRSAYEVDPAAAAKAAGIAADPQTLAALSEAAAFAKGQALLQHEQLTRLDSALALHQLRLPMFFSSSAGPQELSAIASALTEAIEAM
jgi:anion-transporting  ArsA/GET3 family ATPase